MSDQFNDRGPFAVGEICRVVRCDCDPSIVGAEVKITAPAEWRYGPDGRSWLGYSTDMKFGDLHFDPPEEYLRRRKPPASDSHERTYMQLWRDMAGKAPQRQGEPA